MIATFLDDVRDRDMIAPRRMAERLRLPMSRLARLAHVDRNTMTTKPGSPAVQAKLGEIARIITRAAELAGDEGLAIIWFKHQPLSGFSKPRRNWSKRAKPTRFCGRCRVWKTALMRNGSNRR